MFIELIQVYIIIQWYTFWLSPLFNVFKIANYLFYEDFLSMKCFLNYFLVKSYLCDDALSLSLNIKILEKKFPK